MDIGASCNYIDRHGIIKPSLGPSLFSPARIQTEDKNTGWACNRLTMDIETKW